MSQFVSPKEALGYYYACLRGPELVRPRYSEIQRSRRMSEVWLLIGTLVYGPESEGCLGVQHGSDLDEQLRRYVCAQDEGGRSKAVRRLLSKLGKLLEHWGLRVVVRRHTPRPKPSAYTEHVLVEADGSRPQPPRLLCEVAVPA